MKWLKNKFKKNLIFNPNQKGLALLLAMFTLTIVSFLAMELSYQTNVEYIVNSQSIQRLKAYYAARSGMELSLLRIKLYSQVQGQYAQMLGSQAANSGFTMPLLPIACVSCTSIKNITVVARLTPTP